MGTELSGGAPLKSCVQWRGGGGGDGGLGKHVKASKQKE